MSSISDQLTSIGQLQKTYFQEGNTVTAEFRITQLQLLHSAIVNHETEILEALRLDLGKSDFEGYTTEIGFVLAEIKYNIKHLRTWMKAKKVSTPFSLFPSKSSIVPQPYGKTLIIAPWNYPFQLLLAPLVAAIAAGNCALLKPSELTPNTSAILAKIIQQTFSANFVTVIEGLGHETVPQAIEHYQPNLIFFTGSTAVGKIIAKQAAEYLIPCVLELGGKSPCIVDGTTPESVTARRIWMGKTINAGQTCVAPDYALVPTHHLDDFVKQLKKTSHEFWGHNALQSEQYTKIVNQHHFQRLLKLLEGAEILFGGKSDSTSLRIEPTVVKINDLNHPLMKEEIFGPILPVIGFDSLDELYHILEQHPNPLAFYVFSQNEKFANRLIQRFSFGGGCINNTLMHLVSPELPFGGVGGSGQGSYHGKFGFDAFTHYKSILNTANWFDLKQKYPPYTESALKLVKKFM